jgi:hypothetical protein
MTQAQTPIINVPFDSSKNFMNQYQMDQYYIARATLGIYLQWGDVMKAHKRIMRFRQFIAYLESKNHTNRPSLWWIVNPITPFRWLKQRRYMNALEDRISEYDIFIRTRMTPPANSRNH